MANKGYQTVILNLKRMSTHISMDFLAKILPDRDNIAVLLEMDCGSAAVKITEMISDLDKFVEGTSWMVITKNFTDTIKILSTANLNLNSDVVIAISTITNSECWLLYDVYNQGYKYGGKFNVTLRGIHSVEPYKKSFESPFPEPLILDPNIRANDLNKKVTVLWEESNKFTSSLQLKLENHENRWSIFSQESWVRRRWNVQNITLTHAQVSTAKFNGTFEHFASTPDQVHVETMHRYNYALLTHLAQMIGFRLEHKRVGEWGLMRNGTAMGGALGLLQRGVVDLTSTPTAVRTDRLGVGELTVVAYIVRIPIIFLQPLSVAVSLKTFTRPLEESAWWVTFATCVCVLFSYLLTVRFEVRLEARPTKDDS